MVYDLESELEVIKAFFARSIGWVAREVADESTRLAVTGQPDDELIEQVVTDPRGAEVLEQIILRAVINELSSLYEFALQQAWIRLSGLNVPIGKGPRYDENELVFVANRGRVEKALMNTDLLGDAITNVENWPYRREILEIKELAEGFKHRHRLQPLPDDCYQPRHRPNSIRRVEPGNRADENPFVGYLVTQPQVAQYIQAFEELLRWLSSKDMLGLM